MGGGSREDYITRVKGKYMRLEMDTYLDVDVDRVADKSGPAEEYLRGWWCVVQRRLIRLCEGEPSAARLYKPARLRDSRTPSHPMHGPHPRGWFPPRRRFAAKAFSSNQTYPCTSVTFLLLPFTGGNPRSCANSNLAAEVPRPSLGFLGMGVFHRCLPLKTFAREESVS